MGSHTLHLGVVRENREVLASAHLVVHKDHEPWDMADLIDRLVKYLSMYDVKRIVIEKPLVFPGQGYPILKMAEMFTLVKLAAYRIDAALVIVTPSQWRKKVLGKGNVTKAVAVNFVKELGWKPDDHNVAEAITMACY